MRSKVDRPLLKEPTYSDQVYDEHCPTKADSKTSLTDEPTYNDQETNKPKGGYGEQAWAHLWSHQDVTFGTFPKALEVSGICQDVRARFDHISK